MLKRSALLSAVILALILVAGSLGYAQTPGPVPEAGIRGSGMIAVRNANYGTFTINVSKSGDILFGGLRFTELSPVTTKPVNMIYSQTITGLKVEGGLAVVKALGYWNGMPSTITVEAMDTPYGDKFHITAQPRNALTIIYDAGGPLKKGDLVVFGNTVTPDGIAKGQGGIKFNGLYGRFTFSVSRIGGITKGTLYYVELSPMTASTVIPDGVRIYCPAVEALDIKGNTAYFKGKGLLNGKPAMIEVKVADNVMPMSPVEMRDEFCIRATPVVTDALSTMGYSAGGPLAAGDIVVRTVVQPTPILQ